MSQRAVRTSTGILGALDRATTLVRHTTVRQAWYDLGWHWLAGLATLLILDLILAVPVWFRWFGLIALVAYPIATAVHIRQKIANKEFPDEQAARLVEEGHPELDNALINAVQFQRVLDGTPDAQAGLMRHEISRAERAVETTSIDDVVSREGERKARVALFVSIGSWVAAIILIPGVVFTILPRLFAPWMDDLTPHFSLTKIEISPKGATVRYGGALVVSATLKGPIPEGLTLSTRSGKGDWADVPLESTEPGKYAITLSGLREDTWIVANGGGARSARYLVKVVLPPIAQSLQATYTYPAYTGQKEFTEAVGDKGIHGLRETKVNLQVTANRDLTGGELVMETGEGPAEHFILQVSDKDSKVATASFPITASGTFHVALASSDSQVNSDAARGKVVLDRDEHPNVWFNEPPKEIVVTPDMKVGLDVEADDDIGVNRIDLHRVVNGIADNAATLYEGIALKKAGNHLVMDMADLGVRPGDEITYYANAYDNDPGHPNYAETEAYKIKVLSAQDYEKLLKDQRDSEQLAREIGDIKDAIGSLADRQQDLADKMDKLQKELAKKPGDPSLAKQIEAAQAEQKKLQEEALQMARRLQDYAKSPSGSPIEKAIKEKVAEAAQGISKAANEGMKSAQKPGNPATAAQGAKQAADAMKRTANAADKSVGEAIKNIEKVMPLFQDVETFKSLLDRQGQLVLQARQFEQSSPNDDAARSKMEAIAAEQKQIQEELKALQEDFRRHAVDAQKDFPKAAGTAVKIADEIGRRQIPDLMGSASEKFGEQNGQDGFASAQKALEQMQAMVPQAGQCQSQCKGELDLKLNSSLGKSGLGQSLGMCSNPGMGSGNGQGIGSGAGGMNGGGSGMSGSGTSASSPVAYTMSTKSLAGSSGTKRTHATNRMEGRAAELSSDRIEVLPNGERKPPKASDSASKNYPPEYKKLIKDYFISVTKEKKP